MATATRAQRTTRAQLQRRVDVDRGIVLERVQRTDRHHRSVGWWWAPVHERAGCECRHCRAARAGGHVYLGYNIIDAGGALDAYAEAHP